MSKRMKAEAGNGSSHYRATIGPNAADMGLRTSQNSNLCEVRADYRLITAKLPIICGNATEALI